MARETRPAMTATDLDLGSFSDQPPWIVDPAAMRWRRAVPGLRAEIADELPQLTRAGRLPPGARVVRTTRLLGTALGGWYFGARRRDPARSTAVNFMLVPGLILSGRAPALMGLAARGSSNQS